MSTPEEALKVLEDVSTELDAVPNVVADGRNAMQGLRSFFVESKAKMEDMERANRTLAHQLLGAETRLDIETRELQDRYEGQIVTLQTEVERLQLLVDEARAEERWITERVAEVLQVPPTSMRELTEQIIILVTEAKQMVQESL